MTSRAEVHMHGIVAMEAAENVSGIFFLFTTMTGKMGHSLTHTKITQVLGITNVHYTYLPCIVISQDFVKLFFIVCTINLFIVYIVYIVLYNIYYNIYN